eukprot:COSAG02_NODE_11520_length_1707_cov_2.000622_3_plen_122_part_00
MIVLVSRHLTTLVRLLAMIIGELRRLHAFQAPGCTEYRRSLLYHCTGYYNEALKRNLGGSSILGEGVQERPRMRRTERKFLGSIMMTHTHALARAYALRSLNLVRQQEHGLAGEATFNLVS